MFGIKACGIILIIVASSGIGFSISNIMKLRLLELAELKKLILMLRGEIKYIGTPLGEAFGVIGRRTKGIYSTLFQDTEKELEKLDGKNIADIWKEQMETAQMIKKSHLSDNDWKWLLNFAQNLGYLDKEMQLGTIELYMEQLESTLAEGNRSYGKNSKLCKCLGISAGLLLTIVFL
ncbi:MAG: stage III sporulation protein AB [Lachnospiraceae bacterium]|nr:stage III sporulation protein AB [Lachnospiraceae bacterium]